MKRILACLATAAFAALASIAGAKAQGADPIGDLISAASPPAVNSAGRLNLKATLYHANRSLSARDSLGCPVAPMRTLAVDPSVIARHSIVYIKETAGMALPDGGVHDGYWYASDIGGAIKGNRIDLFTGRDVGSMRALMPLNLKVLTVSKVGQFSGCPPLDRGMRRLASLR